jgi:hypothetical protein
MSTDHDPLDNLELFGGVCNSMALRLFQMAAKESPEAMQAVVDTLQAMTRGEIRLELTVCTGGGEPSRIKLTAINLAGERWELPEVRLQLGAVN